MEKYAIFLDTKIQYYKAICSPQIELQILFKPSQNVLPSQYFFVETDKMILFFFLWNTKG